MIRNATKNDLDKLLEIYACARAFMLSTGNMTQWSGGYPDKETVISDIDAEQLYVVCGDNGTVCGCFVLMSGPDPTYLYIDGKWK